MTTYLGYVRGGVCRDTHASTRDGEGNVIRPPMVRKQLWVREELRHLGIEAWCGIRVQFKRVGNQREWSRFDVPALPNYLVMEMEPEQVFQAIQVPHLVPTFSMVSRYALEGAPAVKAQPEKGLSAKAAVTGLRQFREAVEAQLRAAERVDANSRASVSEFKENQSLRVVSGPFADLMVRFDKLVKAPHDQWPLIGARTETGLTVHLDPLDVKRA